jgi:serine/threonine protein kinase
VRIGDHPNIVYAYSVDEVAGQLFVEAELVEGDELGRVSLRDYLRSGRLQPNTIAAWSADFCYGLEHALSKGLVSHRDIKPENLLIGRSGVLRVTDFGIARAMVLAREDAKLELTKLGVWRTNGGQVSGTPPYMAPEQWRGAKQDIRTDIYAFGVVPYEMCYGRLPFVGPGIELLMEQHLYAKPQLAPGMFAEVVGRCLSKDPLSRYDGPTSLLGDVSRICDKHRIALPPRPSAKGQILGELENRAHALSTLGKHREAIDATRELLRLAPANAGTWGQLGRVSLEFGDYAGALAALERSLTLDSTRSPTWNNLGVCLKRLKRWEPALAAFDRALDYDPHNTGAMLNSAEALLHAGRTGEAIARLTRAAKIAPDKYAIWCNLGAAHVHAGDTTSGLACYRRARALAPLRDHSQIDQVIQGLASKS